MKTITQKEEQHAAACCSETKNRYICISEESEGACPDTLFETLPKWIDYIWFVGESFHRREKSPGDGAALIMWCWYLDMAMILSTLFHRIAGGWIFYTVIVPVLLAVPFLFCRLRYTAKRQNEIFTRYSGKKSGRLLLAIWAAIVGIFCLEVLLMVLSRLWSIESHP